MSTLPTRPLAGAYNGNAAYDERGTSPQRDALPIGGGFQTAWCPSCNADVLVARDLDDDDAWVHVCARCDTRLEGPFEQRNAEALTGLGFDLDKVPGESGGCGSGGGCASCS